MASIKKKPSLLNVIGPRVRWLRERKGWTQDRLAVKLQLIGWDVSRNAVTTLENQQRRVTDLELFALARVLGVKADELLPRNMRRYKQLWRNYRPKLSRGQVPPVDKMM